MKKSIFKVGLAILLAFSVAGMPFQILAQTKQTPATEKKETQRKARVLPFRGKIKKLDQKAKTITVGKRTFQITSETKIFKGDKPAIFKDGVVGEMVTGGFKRGEDGKLIATKVTFSPKKRAKAKAAGTTEEKAEK